MFGLSFGELLIIGIVALIVIGPERLPKVARTVGLLMGRAQRYVNDVKIDIQREMDVQELSKLKDDVNSSLNEVKSSFEKKAAAISNPLQQIKSDVHDLENQLKGSLDTLPDLPSVQHNSQLGSADHGTTVTATAQAHNNDAAKDVKSESDAAKQANQLNDNKGAANG